MILTEEDRSWIEMLQRGKPSKDLREHGERARELKQEAENPADWQLRLAAYPIIQERMNHLERCCDDVIPIFVPAFRTV